MDFEKLIIGSILSEPHSSGVACEIVSSSMFTGVNKQIFEVIENSHKEGREIDLFIINSEVDLSNFGGITYLTLIGEQVSSSNRLKEYCFKLKEKFILKTIEKFFKDGINLIKNSNGQEVIDFIQSGYDSIFEQVSETSKGLVHIKSVTEKALQEAEQRVIKRQKGESVGITTGLRALDKMLHYLRGGQLIVLGGRPAMGKTSIGLNFAKSAALTGVPVCIYSLEMSDVSLVDRMIFSISDVDSNAYKMGEIEDWSELMKAQALLSKLPIYIDDNAKVSIPYIRNHTRMMAKKGQCGMIVIDYLQLADLEEKGKSREQEVSKASRQCKALARELNVPVILLSQLSRAVEDEKEKRPELRHLRESGAIEQDADIVLFAYRAAYYDIDEIEIYVSGGGSRVISSDRVGEILVAKNREGGVGSVVFRHNENLTKIDNY